MGHPLMRFLLPTALALLLFPAAGLAQNFGNIKPNTVLGNPDPTASKPAVPTEAFVASVDVRQFGADPTGVNNSAPAIQAALNYVGTSGAKLTFPAGKFKLDAAVALTLPTGSKGVSIQGAGAGQTTLYWPNAAGGLSLTLSTYKQNVTLRDFALTTGVAGGGTALSVTNTSCSAACSLEPTSIIDHVTAMGDDGPSNIFYWNLGFLVTSISNVTLTNNFITGNSAFNADGIKLISSAAHLGAGYTFGANNFSCLNRGLIYGDYIQGVMVGAGNNFVCGNYGIYVATGTPGTLEQLSVVGSSFNHSISSIYIGAQMYGFTLDNNLFIPGNGTVANATGITLAAGFHGTISKNYFQGGGAGSKGVALTTGAAGAGFGLIQGNVCTNIVACYDLQSTTVRVTQDNVYGPGVGTRVNSIAGNEIDGTFAWTPTLSGSSTPGSPTYSAQLGSYTRNGAMVTAHFTLTGTSLGGAAGGLAIAGLPLTVAGSYGTCTVFGGGPKITAGVGSNQYVMLGGIIAPSASAIGLTLGADATTGTQTSLTAAQMTPTFSLFGNCTYTNYTGVLGTRITE